MHMGHQADCARRCRQPWKPRSSLSTHFRSGHGRGQIVAAGTTSHFLDLMALTRMPSSHWKVRCPVASSTHGMMAPSSVSSVVEPDKLTRSTSWPSTRAMLVSTAVCRYAGVKRKIQCQCRASWQGSPHGQQKAHVAGVLSCTQLTHDAQWLAHHQPDAR